MIKVFALFSMQNVVSCGTFNVLLFNKKKKKEKNSNKIFKTEIVSSVSELSVQFGT